MTAALATPLSPLEARVLGVLIEKELATPDYYPLTLNALLQGCNQKTSRNPVMEVGEAQAQTALDGLKHQNLVLETYGASGRVMRYAHNLPKVLGVGQQVSALLAALMLRGPVEAGQPAGEAAHAQADDISAGELAALKSQLAHLREEVGQLRAMVERLYKDLGQES